MRKKRSAILLTFVYVVLLISLLVLQSFSIEGKLPKFAANVIAVVLVIPGGFLKKDGRYEDIIPHYFDVSKLL